jgi:hypothetical protein
VPGLILSDGFFLGGGLLPHPGKELAVELVEVRDRLGPRLSLRLAAKACIEAVWVPVLIECHERHGFL